MDLSAFRSFQAGSGALSASYSIRTGGGGAFPGIKCPECEADRSPPFSSEITKHGAILYSSLLSLFQYPLVINSNMLVCHSGCIWVRCSFLHQVSLAIQRSHIASGQLESGARSCDWV